MLKSRFLTLKMMDSALYFNDCRNVDFGPNLRVLTSNSSILGSNSHEITFLVSILQEFPSWHFCFSSSKSSISSIWDTQMANFSILLTQTSMSKSTFQHDFLEQSKSFKHEEQGLIIKVRCWFWKVRTFISQMRDFFNLGPSNSEVCPFCNSKFDVKINVPTGLSGPKLEF